MQTKNIKNFKFKSNKVIKQKSLLGKPKKKRTLLGGFMNVFKKNKFININSNKSLVEAVLGIIDTNETTRKILITQYINTISREYRTIIKICIYVFLKKYDKFLFPKTEFKRIVKSLFIEKFDNLNLKLSNYQGLIKYIKNTDENTIITNLNLKLPNFIKNVILVIIQKLKNSDAIFPEGFEDVISTLNLSL